MFDICEADYAMWSNRSIIADCLKSLGFNNLSKEIMYIPANIGIIEEYLFIIKEEAEKRQNNDVLIPLYHAGLLLS